MSKPLFCGEDTDAALPVHDASVQRKRSRAEEEGDVLVSYSRHVPPHVRVQVLCGGYTSLLSLRGHVLDAEGRFNAAEFPGLTFFFSPSVLSVESGTVVLHFPDACPAHDYIANYKRHHPCPVHGPFRCPCHIMHEVAGAVTLLLREIFCQHAPFDVTIDCERSYPHMCIHSESQTWTISLVGLPLPPRKLGPFPLGGVASPQSIKSYWSQYGQRSKVSDDVCVMCGVATATQCASCACRICARCSEECGVCGGGVCRGCCAADERGVTNCYRCAY